MSRSRLVAAMTRTSTLLGDVPPTRSNSCSCRTRSSLAWVSSGQLADLVEEDRAAVGQLEPAGVPGDRAGERPLLVAEQLALDEPRGQGRAVDLDQRLVPAAGCWSGSPGRSAPCRCPSRRRSRPWRRWAPRGGPCRARPVSAGAAADDLLEVVDRLDLFLEVEVLLPEPGPLGLGEHAVGDVDPDRMDGLDRPRRRRASAASRG